MCCTKFHQCSTTFRNTGKVLCCLSLLESMFSVCMHPSSLRSTSAEQQRNPVPHSLCQRCVFLASECSERKTLRMLGEMGSSCCLSEHKCRAFRARCACHGAGWSPTMEPTTQCRCMELRLCPLVSAASSVIQAVCALTCWVVKML